METSDTQRTAGVNPWSILLLLAIALLISFIDRTSLSSALADKHFIREFGLTSIERGWLNSAFFWSYGLFQLLMGWIVDRYGVKWPYAVCFLLWCLATVLTGVVSTIGMMIVMRLLIGAAEAIVMPASYRWMGDNFKESEKGFAVGLFTMGGKFGPAIGAPVAAWMIVHHSWQMMFLLTGSIGLLWLAPWLLMVKSDLPSRGQLAAAKRRAASVTFGSLLASPVVWGGMINNFCYGYFTFYCMTWMPAYLVEQRGLSLQNSGLYTFFSFAGIAIVATIAGWVADRMIARGGDAVKVRKGFVIAGFIGGTTVLLGAYAGSLGMALFWNVLSLSLLGLVTANNTTLCKLTLIPKPAIGLNTGLQQVATSLAGGVSASLSGWLLHVGGSYRLPMMAIFAFLLVGAASSVILLRREWAPKVADFAPNDAPKDVAKDAPPIALRPGTERR
jgi:MFS transporter, ACS family, D-galactonate transporter